MKAKSTDLAKAQNITELSIDLNDIAAHLAGVQVVLKMLPTETDPKQGDALHMVAGMIEHLNERICNAADRLS